MRRLALVAALAGCSAAGADGPPAFQVEGPALSVYAHSAELEAAARGAAERIEAASGLVVEVNVQMGGALPMFRSSSLGHRWGLAHSDELAGDWIAVADNVPDRALEVTATHEILHALGAGHVRQGLGILSPGISAGLAITTTDLEKLCSRAACSRFAPEVEN